MRRSLKPQLLAYKYVKDFLRDLWRAPHSDEVDEGVHSNSLNCTRLSPYV
jgi:hypothetical protein